MNDFFLIGAALLFVLFFAVFGGWLARNDPRPLWRAVAAMMITTSVSVGSLEIGCRLSNLRGPWAEVPGYSCGESKVLGLILIFGAVFLIRAVWQSTRAEGSEATRASRLTLTCLGLSLIGFTLSESEKAHDRFHQAQHQAEARR